MVEQEPQAKFEDFREEAYPFVVWNPDKRSKYLQTQFIHY